MVTAAVGHVVMAQYDAYGRFVRRAKFNAALMTIWARQLPYGHIVMEVK